MTLHLVRLPVDLRALAAFAVANGVSDDDGGYALHRAMRDRFGTAGPQPFRFLPDQSPDRGGPQVLGYLGNGDSFTDAAGLPAADPLLDRVFGTAAAPKAMPKDWREGARYAFEVRLRPVVRYGGRVRAARAERDGAWLTRGGKSAQEVDAFVAACERAGAREEGGVPVDREAVYHDWLTRQFIPAAELEAVELRQFQRIRTHRSNHGKPGRPRVEGPEAIMTGTLVVRDPAAFAAVLARGVGRHAAFGFGMLLLSPPRRA